MTVNIAISSLASVQLQYNRMIVKRSYGQFLLATPFPLFSVPSIHFSDLLNNSIVALPFSRASH